MTILDLEGSAIRRRYSVFDLSSGTVGDMDEDEPRRLQATA